MAEAEANIGQIHPTQLDLLRIYPDFFAPVGNPPTLARLGSNGKKGPLAAQIGIESIHPHKKILSASEAAEDLYTNASGGGVFTELYPRINGKRSELPFPVAAAVLKNWAIFQYMIEHPHESFTMPPVILTEDIALTINSYVCHKPTTPADRESLIEIIKIASESSGTMGYHSGLCIIDTRNGIVKVRGVETNFGPMKKDPDLQQIEAIQRMYPKSTGGLDYKYILSLLTKRGSTISVRETEYELGNPYTLQGQIMKGSIQFPKRVIGGFEMTHTEENDDILPAHTHGFISDYIR